MPQIAPVLLKAWKDDAIRMKSQPGCVTMQLHRSIAISSVFLNQAV